MTQAQFKNFIAIETVKYSKIVDSAYIVAE